MCMVTTVILGLGMPKEVLGVSWNDVLGMSSAWPPLCAQIHTPPTWTHTCPQKIMQIFSILWYMLLIPILRGEFKNTNLEWHCLYGYPV